VLLAAARVVSVMPTNLYGPNDNFDLLSSHVLPALLRKNRCRGAGGPRYSGDLGQRPPPS
jgi:nucleoside-diphosphate-sugar epimerase